LRREDDEIKHLPTTDDFTEENYKAFLVAIQSSRGVWSNSSWHYKDHHVDLFSWALCLLRTVFFFLFFF